MVSHEATVDAVASAVAELARSGAGRGILARGLGRSYGDAALNSGGRVVATDGLAGLGAVGDDGTVDVGAGVSIGTLLHHVVPRGWFVPVTPGTRHVSLGGAVAADVHGKNHHRDGSIARHVEELEVVDGTGTVRRLGPSDPAFAAVVGGMGLAGIVTRVRLRLVPVATAGLTVETRRTGDLDATMAALVESDQRHRYTVAWVDTLARGPALGRAVLTSGDHTPAPEGSSPPRGAAPTPLSGFSTGRALPTPPWAPSGLLTSGRMRVFNEVYWRRAPRRPRTTVESVTSFFHPLDVADGWNRLYGRTGLLQYQLAVGDSEVVREVLELFRAEGVPGLLAVLKRFGPSSGMPLSFPIPGWTLALDMPAHASLGPVLDRADDLVARAGGRLYLAKDSRLRPDHLPAMYPDLDRWREQRELLDPHHLFVSDLSRRLSLC
jgi:decaprenylphospho-beta-D-ribofuranose 2-oxidase